MDQNQIKELIKLINQTEIGEVKIEKGDFKITIRRKDYAKKSVIAPVSSGYMPTPTVASVVTSAVTQQEKSEEKPKEETAPPSGKDYYTMKSPMIGTFYRSPGPEKEPFVKVGDTIEKGQVLCIVEAMKLFNEIESEISGTIIKVLVDNHSPVEYDQPLFLIDPQ
ncbi:MAG: acetyl-CoA carboxylase biotin carboxyl carrier protein [Chitinophagales bacterium]|nr:acetyl-CoA carboxylase biotin carboxyl carrier protein [Chitinophagales bacterium]